MFFRFRLWNLFAAFSFVQMEKAPLDDLPEATRMVQVKQTPSTAAVMDASDSRLLTVPRGWECALEGGQCQGKDDYHRLRSLLQVIFELS